MKKFCFPKSSSIFKKAISVICALCVIISVIAIVPIVAKADDEVVTSLSNKAKMLMFVGTSAGSGGNGKIEQDVQLQPNKKYQLSFFVKYGGTGLDGEKIGAELQYKKDNAFVALTSEKNTDIKYLETYTFTMPADAQSGVNFKLLFHASSAYTSGYVTNFKLYELGSGNSIVGNNLVKNGDFSTGTVSNWVKSGAFYKFDFGNIPENFFNAETPHTPNMIIYSKPTDYSQVNYSPQLKPGTKYEMRYQELHTDFIEGAEPSIPIWQFYTDENGQNVNSGTSGIERVKDGAYTSAFFTTRETLRTNSNNNAIIRYYMRTGSAGYWGALELYELDENGNRVSNNIIINGDFTNGLMFWETGGDFSMRIVENKDFFENYHEPLEMISSKGTLADQVYGQKLQLDAKKEYCFSGFYVNMNAEGITPQVQYLPRSAKGTENYEELPVEFSYDTDRYYFEASFTIPKDALITKGMADIRIQFTNNNKGKFYLAEPMLCEAGKYDNLLTNMTFEENGNYEKLPYNKGVFIFYYDDKMFDDGDWSGEFSNSEYNIQYGTLTGRVVNEEGVGLAGKVVQLGSDKISVKTDENGDYSFNEVEPNTYKLYILDKDNEPVYCSDITVKKGIWSIMPLAIFTEAVTTVTVIEPEDTSDSTTSDTTDTEEESYGMLRGFYYDRQGKIIKGASISVRGVGSAVTDDKGMFMFEKVPEGKYDLYTKLEDGTEHVFRQVDVKANKGMQVKIMEPAQEQESGTPWLMIMIISGSVIVLAGVALTVILLMKKKK